MKVKKGKPATDGKPVLVATEYRVVFFGYLVGEPGEHIRLGRARNVLHWSSEAHGFLGLAAKGPPSSGSRVSPAADIYVRRVTYIADCTPEAVERFEAEPWSK